MTSTLMKLWIFAHMKGNFYLITMHIDPFWLFCLFFFLKLHHVVCILSFVCIYSQNQSGFRREYHLLEASTNFSLFALLDFKLVYKS